MPEAKWGGWVRQVRSGTEAGGTGNEGGGGGEAGKKWDYFLVCFLQPIVQDGCNVINWCV